MHNLSKHAYIKFIVSLFHCCVFIYDKLHGVYVYCSTKKNNVKK